MAHATWQTLYQPAFIATFSIGAGVVFILTLAWRLKSGRHLADASVDAIAASYPNTGYLGFPLAFIVFGEASRTPTTIATILVACLLFAMAIVLIEIGLQTEKHRAKLATTVVMSLAKNPLIFSPIAGVVVSGLHWTLPGSAETFLKMLGAAASPCALVSLGLFLAEKRSGAKLQRESVILALAKLVIQPVIAWWFAAHVFHMSATMVDMTVVLSALPTGTGPFMLAEFYRREAVITSQTILLTTLFSLATLTLLLSFMSRLT